MFLDCFLVFDCQFEHGLNQSSQHSNDDSGSSMHVRLEERYKLVNALIKLLLFRLILSNVCGEKRSLLDGLLGFLLLLFDELRELGRKGINHLLDILRVESGCEWMSELVRQKDGVEISGEAR